LIAVQISRISNHIFQLQLKHISMFQGDGEQSSASVMFDSSTTSEDGSGHRQSVCESNSESSWSDNAGSQWESMSVRDWLPQTITNSLWNTRHLWL
jgi:hypothetical protein